MKTLFRKALDSRGITRMDAVRATRITHMTVYMHYDGRRKVKAEQALKYEDALGIPRSELRPDLWPPQ